MMKHILIPICLCFLSLGQLLGAEEVKTVRGKVILGDDVKNIVPGAMVTWARFSDLTNSLAKTFP